MKHLFLILFILSHLNGYTQTAPTNYNFNHKVMEVEGDLNKDSLPDKAIVTQEETDIAQEMSLVRYQSIKEY